MTSLSRSQERWTALLRNDAFTAPDVSPAAGDDPAGAPAPERVDIVPLQGSLVSGLPLCPFAGKGAEAPGAGAGSSPRTTGSVPGIGTFAPTPPEPPTRRPSGPTVTCRELGSAGGSRTGPTAGGIATPTEAPLPGETPTDAVGGFTTIGPTATSVGVVTSTGGIGAVTGPTVSAAAGAAPASAQVRPTVAPHTVNANPARTISVPRRPIVDDLVRTLVETIPIRSVSANGKVSLKRTRKGFP